MKTAFAFTATILLALSSLSCEGPAGPAGPPGDPYTSLSDPSVMPKVIYSYPGANTTGPFPELYLYECELAWCDYYSQIQLRFNKFMDPTSVRRAVSITSPGGDIHSDTNYILTIGGDIFILNPVDSTGFRPRARFKIGGVYSIGVESSARDINGNALSPPFEATFVPEPYFRVMRVDPADGSVEVDPGGWITLNFNSKVDSSVLSHLSIEPDSGGVWMIGNDSLSALYHPANILPPATTMNVRVDGSAGDADGNRLQAPFSSTFTTVAFRVTGTYPVVGANGVGLSITPGVNFSVPLDTGTIRGSFQITPATAGYLSGVYNGTRTIVFNPLDGLRSATMYTVRIDNTLRDVSGNPLTGGFQFSFTTSPFAVTSTQPPHGANGVSRSDGVQVALNGPVDVETVSGAVTILPSILFTTTSYDGAYWFSLYPNFSFDANTTYTVTVWPSLKTLRGDSLSAPYSFSFTTGPN